MYSYSILLYVGGGGEENVLRDIRRVTGDAGYTPTDPQVNIILSVTAYMMTLVI